VTGAATGTPVGLSAAERLRLDQIQRLQKELDDTKARIRGQ
jgi:hypothetical protein